jgi:hypothetical protein
MGAAGGSSTRLELRSDFRVAQFVLCDMPQGIRLSIPEWEFLDTLERCPGYLPAVTGGSNPACGVEKACGTDNEEADSSEVCAFALT